MCEWWQSIADRWETTEWSQTIKMRELKTGCMATNYMTSNTTCTQTANIKPHSCSYWYTQAGPAHAAVVVMAWTNDSTLAIFFYIHALLVASIALLWEQVEVQWLWHRHRESGNKDKRHRQIAMRLHWIDKSVSGLHPCCHHRGVRLSMVHVFNSWVVFELTHDE